MGLTKIDLAQRRARLAVRHHLVPGSEAGAVAVVARDLAGLHATDPVTMYLGAMVRLRDGTVEAVQRALYDDRSVLRMLGMRRTLFALPVELAPVVHSACTVAIAAKERTRLLESIEAAGIPKAKAWLQRLEDAAHAALLDVGEATTAEVTKAVPELQTKVLYGAGTKWATEQSVGMRVMFQLASDGRIARGRPRGTWISTQHRWAPVEAWLPDGMPDMATDVAQAELISRWLAAFGPGTVKDIKWWTGLTVREVKRALEKIGAVEVALDDGTGFVLADDVEPVPVPKSWVALLPALDSTTMGWAERDWYLGPHRPRVFDTNGNAGPTVWADGRVVGGWTQRKDGAVIYELLEPLKPGVVKKIDAAAADMADRLGETRFVPRFRTPLERELGA